MCGGFKASARFWRAKEDQINAEMRRLARLKSGERYHFPTTDRLVGAIFGGHARSENLNSVWNGKILKHVKLESETFAERNTVKGTGDFVHFRVPNGKAIHAIITKDNELRIVTEPARGNVVKVHHRMPQLIDKEEK